MLRISLLRRWASALPGLPWVDQSSKCAASTSFSIISVVMRREAASWDESQQTQTDTICPSCGVGCNLTLHVQDNEIVKVTSPDDHDITRGNLCIKGRFGFQHVQPKGD